MKVLIIGSGPVGLSAMLGLNYNKSKVDLFLSEQTENSKSFVSLFGSQIPYNFSGRGGLGRFWHNVIDISLACNSHARSSLGIILDEFWSIKLSELDLALERTPDEYGLEIVPQNNFRPNKENTFLKAYS